MSVFNKNDILIRAGELKADQIFNADAFLAEPLHQENPPTILKKALIMFAASPEGVKDPDYLKLIDAFSTTIGIPDTLKAHLVSGDFKSFIDEVNKIDPPNDKLTFTKNEIENISVIANIGIIDLTAITATADALGKKSTDDIAKDPSLPLPHLDLALSKILLARVDIENQRRIDLKAEQDRLKAIDDAAKAEADRLQQIEDDRIAAQNRAEALEKLPEPLKAVFNAKTGETIGAGVTSLVALLETAAYQGSAGFQAMTDREGPFGEWGPLVGAAVLGGGGILGWKMINGVWDFASSGKSWGNAATFALGAIILSYVVDAYNKGNPDAQKPTAGLPDPEDSAAILAAAAERGEIAVNPDVPEESPVAGQVFIPVDPRLLLPLNSPYAVSGGNNHAPLGFIVPQPDPDGIQCTFHDRGGDACDMSAIAAAAAARAAAATAYTPPVYGPQ